MSALKDRLRADLTTSIKARDEIRSSTLRMVLTAITNAEVAGKEQRELSDDDIAAARCVQSGQLPSASVARPHFGHSYASCCAPSIPERTASSSDFMVS